MPERTVERWRSSRLTPRYRQVIRLLEKCLQEGRRVELEGLGAFERDESGELQFRPSTRPKVFLAYVDENAAEASRLFEILQREGCDPWMDRERLLPGQNWPRAVERAIDLSDYFVAIFSKRAIVKKGQFQTELRQAMECARRQPLDSDYLIPVRLEECVLPEKITKAIQYVNLFPDWDRGVGRLLETLHKPQR